MIHILIVYFDSNHLKLCVQIQVDNEKSLVSTEF